MQRRTMTDRQGQMPLNTSRKFYGRSKTPKEDKTSQTSYATSVDSRTPLESEPDARKSSRHTRWIRMQPSSMTHRALRTSSLSFTRSFTHQKRRHDCEDIRNQPQHAMTAFTTQELDDSINQLKKGKASDTRDVSAEVVKHSSRRVKPQVLVCFFKNVFRFFEFCTSSKERRRKERCRLKARETGRNEERETERPR